MNSKIVSEPTGEQMTLFSPVGSLNYANPTHLQESDLEKKMTVISGRKCLDAFGRLSRAGSWAKTFSELLIGTGDWYSTRCNLTWKLKGTKYKRMYFQLAPSMPRTEEIGYGLLRTPTTAEAKNQSCSTQIYLQDQLGITNKLLPTPLVSNVHHAERIKKLKEAGAETMMSRKLGASRPNGLIDYLDFNGMLPTPTTSEVNANRGSIEYSKKQLENPNRQNHLAHMAKVGMLPTPTQRDFKTGSKEERPKAQPSRRSELNHLIAQEIGTTSLQLNPQFVGEMMGFPPDWTELPFLSGETNPSKHTETP